MRMNRDKIAVGVFLCGLLLATPMVLAQDLIHARVSFENGNSMVKGNDDADWSYATINTIVMPGDTLWVDKEGTLELEMSGGTFLRMADGSKAEVASLPPSGGIRLWTGSAYVQRLSRSSGDVVIETPVCKVSVGQDSQVRMDVISNGATTVSVRWGDAVVRAEGGGDVAVTHGQRSYVDPGYLPSEPAAFDLGVEDDFDSWNRERARLLAVGADTIPPSVPIKSAPIGVSDLAPYGEWVYVDSAYYWHPTVVVDFVPYRYGHWSFIPGCGYVWVGDYPFCYVTTHYGRWRHHDTYGWLWTYRDTWGPAWVASVQYGPNFVWAPLDPWDVPCSFGAEYFDVGGYQIGFGASSYCGIDDLLWGPCGVYPFTPVIIRNFPVTEINIWNINIGSRGRFPFQFRDNTLRVRDFSPRRVIRGPDAFGGGARGAARTRVASLEGGDKPTQWRAVAASEMRGSRTTVEEATRAARARSVRVERDVLSNQGRTVSRNIKGEVLPTTLANTDRVRTVRDGGSRPATARTAKGSDEASLPRPMRTRTAAAAGGSVRVEERPRDTVRETGRGSEKIDLSKPSARSRTATRDIQEAPVTPPQSRGVREVTRPPTKTYVPRVRRPEQSFESSGPQVSTPSPGESSRSRVVRLGPKAESEQPAPVQRPERVRMPEVPSMPQVSAPYAPRIPQVSQPGPIIREPAVRQFAPPPAPEIRHEAAMRAPEPAPMPMRIREAAPEPPRMAAPPAVSMPSVRSQTFESGSSGNIGSREGRQGGEKVGRR